MVRGTNLTRLGGFNQDVVFDAIRRSRDGVSRVELAAQTGLTAQTVSNIVRRLLEDGLVRESGQVPQAGRGKPRTILRVRAEARHALGVHVDPASITAVLVDIEGTVLGYLRRRVPDDVQPARVIEEVTGAISRLLTSSGIDPRGLLGLGVAAPGPIDVVQGVVLDPPQLHGWGRVDLRAQLHEATGMRVLLEKDVTAAATAELWAQAGGWENFVFCYLGSGVGAGIVMDGRVLRGTTNNLGEIGEIAVECPAVDIGVATPGSLAATVLPQAMVVKAQRRGLIEAHVGVADFASIDQAFTALCERAYAGEADVVGLLDEVTQGLATGMAVLVNALNVDRLVFGGPSWSRLSSHVLSRLPALIEPRLKATFTPLIVEGSAVGEHVAAQGAAALVLDHFLSPRQSALVIS